MTAQNQALSTTPVRLPEELTPQQLLALYAEVGGARTNEICRDAGCVYLTLKKWQALPAYQAKKRELMDRIEAERLTRIVDAGAVLDGACVDAATTVKTIMSNVQEDSSVRLRAATAIFDYSPNGPKAGKRADGRVVDTRPIINISVNAMKNISEALVDVGQRDVLELVQGEGGAYGVDADDAKRADASDMIDI